MNKNSFVNPFVFQGLLCLFLVLFGCDNDQNTTAINEEIDNTHSFNVLTLTSDTLNVGFLMINGVYNSELMAPYDIFHHTVFHVDPAMKVFTVSPDSTIVTTFEGLRILPDYSFESAPEIDVLVVPSAEHNMDTDLEDAELISFVKERGAKASLVMSLCDGAFVLAEAGLLDGQKCTTFPGDIAAFRERFPQLDVYENVSFVHDGKTITSAGGAKSYDPSMYLVEYLYGKEAADGVAGGMVIDWDLEKVQSIH